MKNNYGRVLLVVMLAPWLLGSSPSLPEQQYRITGTVVSKIDGSLKNDLWVYLLGKKYPADYEQIKSLNIINTADIQNTFTVEGKFSLQVTNQTLYDSIKIVVFKGQDTTLSNSIPIQLADKTDLLTTTANSGCFSDTYDTHQEGYVLTFPSQTIEVP